MLDILKLVLNMVHANGFVIEDCGFNNILNGVKSMMY
jgi:hypothetical protein